MTFIANEMWSTDRWADGRKRPACCKISKAPDKPAICSADICKIPGVCNNDGTPGIAANKRDLVSSSPAETHTLEKRGQDHYIAYFPSGLEFYIFAAAVNAIASLYAGQNSNLITRQEYRLMPGSCVGPAITINQVGPGSNPPGLIGDETEHPLEVCTSLKPSETGDTDFTPPASIFGQILGDYSARETSRPDGTVSQPSTPSYRREGNP